MGKNGRFLVGLAMVVIIGGLILGGEAPALADKSAKVDKATNARIRAAYGKLPLYFIQNNGQLDERVKFYEKGMGHTTFFTEEGVYLQLISHQSSVASRQSRLPQKERVSPKSPLPQGERARVRGESTIIKLLPLGANKNPEIIAEELQKGKVNYFIGNDKKKWRTNIPTYQAVRYKGVYDGIDIRFYGNNRQLEYDIIVKPGADPAQVRLSYEGIEGLELTKTGDLEISLKQGRLIQKKPYIYQEIGGKRVEVEGKFRVGVGVSASPEAETDKGSDALEPFGLRQAERPQKRQAEKPQPLPSGERAGVRGDDRQRFTYSFDLAAYNKNYPLIIDPILVYSTYLGGSNDDWGLGIAVDSAGNAYVTGQTDSSNFPTQNPIQGSIAAPTDAFVTKINAAGSSLSYSTYLGGSDEDWGHGIAVDGAGNAYITGTTYSWDFPIASPIQGSLAGSHDAFVTKIDASGSSLSYSTYLGGSDGGEDGWGIAVDSARNAYITGNTDSSNFPTQNPIQGSLAGGYWADAFVTKINAAGSSLSYSTYLGGSGTDSGRGIAVDSARNAYITGYTYSSNFPIASPIQGSFAGAIDAFVTKIAAAGSLSYSTYLGGSYQDYGRGIAVDSAGNAYVTGETNSLNFPTQNPIQGSLAGGLYDAFVTKINAAGSSLSYSTYLGGSDDWDEGYGIAVDTAGNAYITGYTRSADFPIASPIQGSLAGISDAFVTKIDASGSSLSYSTYLGGSGGEGGEGIAVDSAGNAYVTGTTSSSDFPTQNPIQPNIGAGGFYGLDAFVSKIEGGLDCSNPVQLSCGVPYDGETYGGPNNVETYNCWNWTMNGPEMVHTIPLPGPAT